MNGREGLAGNPLPDHQRHNAARLEQQFILQ